MYGTVARMRVKQGMEPELLAMYDRMDASITSGYVGEIVYRSDADPQIYFLAVVFESKEAYMANANSPEQHAEYVRYRAMLEEEPEWHDGEIVHMRQPAMGGA